MSTDVRRNAFGVRIVVARAAFAFVAAAPMAGELEDDGAVAGNVVVSKPPGSLPASLWYVMLECP